jgi:hypothetical protein
MSHSGTIRSDTYKMLMCGICSTTRSSSRGDGDILIATCMDPRAQACLQRHRARTFDLVEANDRLHVARTGNTSMSFSLRIASCSSKTRA